MTNKTRTSKRLNINYDLCVGRSPVPNFILNIGLKFCLSFSREAEFGFKNIIGKKIKDPYGPSFSALAFWAVLLAYMNLATSVHV